MPYLCRSTLRAQGLRTAVAAIALALVAGCGGGDDKPGGDRSTLAAAGASSAHSGQASGASAGGRPSLPPHSAADRRFAETMVALGARTADLAGVASASSGSLPVRALAGAIRRVQRRRAAAFAALLDRWGGSSSLHGGGSSSGARGRALVGVDDLRRLRASAGIAFDRLWLQLVTRQEGVEVSVARAEIRHGRNPAARALARTVIAGNRLDRVRLRGLLGDQGD